MIEQATIAVSPRTQHSGIRAARGIPEHLQQQLKSNVHKELIKRLDLERLGGMTEDRGKQQQHRGKFGQQHRT